MKDLSKVYTTRVTPIEKGKGYWKYLNVEILFSNPDDLEDPIVIGSYIRNYSSFYDTFLPFSKGDNHYALYSKNYQVTSIMSLPDCKHICDTKDVPFCPTGYFVPNFDDHFEMEAYYKGGLLLAEEEKNDQKIQSFTIELENLERDKLTSESKALVSGCVWGDDSGGWKVKVLDISQIENGIISHTDDLGYFQLPNLGLNLKDFVSWEDPNQLHIALGMDYHFNGDGFNKWPLRNLKFLENDGSDVQITLKEKSRV